MRLLDFNVSARRLALRALPAALLVVGTAHAAPPDCVSGNYDTASSTSCTLPAGVTTVKIEAWGGGGGGATGTAGVPGGGGGGGSYCGDTFTVTEGITLNITVGAGGLASQGGGTSSVASGNEITGLSALGGTGALPTTISNTGGPGGAISSCSVSPTGSKYPGGRGFNGTQISPDDGYGGGGGGSARADQAGVDSGGRQGGSGEGNGGAGGLFEGSATSGIAPGGGGGGGYSSVNITAGSGANGRVKLTFILPENGVCGTASNLSLEPMTTAPTGPALCTSGTASDVSPTGAFYEWTCNGIAGGTDSPLCRAPRGYTVTATSGGNGSVSPDSQVVRFNQQATFTLTPDSGFRANSVSGTCGGGISGSTFLSGPVQQSCSATIGFAEVVTENNVPTQKSGVTAKVEVAGCTAVTNVAFTAAPAQGQPANTAFPFGLLGFTATGCTGGDADVWVTYSEAVPAGAKFYKLIDGSYEEYNHNNRPTVISGNTVQFRVTDGSPADADGTVNGTIQDPAGVGVPSAGVVGIPTLSEWGMIILSGLLALGTFVTMRKRRV